MRPGWVSTKLWRESSTWINSTCLILISYWTEVQSIWGIQTVSQIPPQQSLRYPTPVAQAVNDKILLLLGELWPGILKQLYFDNQGL